MSEEGGVPVQLYIYDLTQGMARMFSPLLLGQQIEGVWHTAIVAYGREYFFGGAGITNCAPGTTQLGQPLKKEHLGDTFIPYQVFSDYLRGISNTTFAGHTYNLLEHNCNHFTNEAALFLCGNPIPKYILDLPNTLNPALKAALNSLIENISPVDQGRNNRQDSPDFMQLNTQIEEARLQSAALEQRRSTLSEKIARKEKKKEKKRKKEQQRLGLSNGSSDYSDLSNSGMADAATESAEAPMVVGPRNGDAEPDARVLEIEAEEQREEEERKKNREPPIVFKDLTGQETFDKLVEALGETTLSAEEQQSLDELHQYLVLDEGSWALGDNFLAFIGRLLNDAAVGGGVKVALLRALAASALKDDVVLLLHQDRREHTLMNYAHTVDRLPLPEQQALALFMCNLFENVNSSEWMLYISEWPAGGQQLSNIRATTKLCVHALLSDDAPLRDIGTALVHNFACKEVKTVVFDDVAVEMSMAVLQLLSSRPGEEHLYRALKALARFCLVAADVPQLVQMIGPSPKEFSGTSERCDELIDQIMKKCR